MLAARITRAHLAASLFMNSPNSSGELAAGSMPWDTSFSLMSGISSTLVISRFKRRIASRGVPAGTTMPYQLTASKPEANSLVEGTSGKMAKRLGPVVAKARKRPVLMCCKPMATVSYPS